MTEREIFVAALERQNPAERAAFLDQACGNDAKLRADVAGLLLEHEQLGSFLEKPAAGTTRSEPEASALVGSKIGPYKLLQEIGEGGMGTVFMAEQE